VLAETLGLALPGTAAIPAVHADRLRAAEATGEIAVALARSRLTPDRILTPAAFENALRVLLAIGGSTNAIIHLTAVAGRMGVPIDLATVNRLSDETPVLVDLKPSGQHYMEDFFAAGGLGAVLRELRDRLHLDCLTVTGETLGARLESDDAWVDRAGHSQRAGAVPARRRARRAVRHAGARAAPSSSARRPTHDCSRPRARGGVRLARGPRPRASTIPRSTSTRPTFLVLKNAGRRARRHAGGRLLADPDEALARRREGHGADLAMRA
jgi:dihydroxy-acid dehydratase